MSHMTSARGLRTRSARSTSRGKCSSKNPRCPARVGDVLVFRAADAYVAHRVLRRFDGSYVTSGDAFPEVVEHVDSGDVLGRVTAVLSDASPGAVRIDTPFHQLRGVLYARARPARLALRRAIARTKRLCRPKGNR